MSDYAVQSCVLELITKCVYDVVKALQYLVERADALGLDVHRIVFTGSSAGSALVNYLVYVYHRWSPMTFSPVGAILSAPQFNLPVMCASDLVWRDFIDHMGPMTRLSSIATFGECHMSVECPNKWYGGNWHAKACNSSWNARTHARYCISEAAFN